MRPSLTIVPFPVMLTLLILVAAATGCDEAVVENSIVYQPGYESESNPFFIEGTVVDTQGTPVIGADLHFFYAKHTSSVLFVPMTTDEVSTSSLQFEVAEEGSFMVQVFRLGTREYIETILESVLPVGSYTLAYDQTKWTNGWYIFRITGKNILSQRLVPIFSFSTKQIITTAPLTRTDRNGAFRLRQNIFGLDEKLLTIGSPSATEQYLSVKDSIGFVIHYAGTTQVRWVAIEKNRNMHATFTLQ